MVCSKYSLLCNPLSGGVLKVTPPAPEVELRIIPTVEAVNFNGDFDFVVMAQSPNYTPASADFIMDIFREYIVEI